MARLVQQENDMNSLSRLVLSSLCAALFSVPAYADDAPAGKGPVGKAAEARKEARDKLKEKKGDLKEKVAGARDAATEAKDEAKAEAKEAHKEVKEARKELAEAGAKLRETRKARRQERREEIKKKWGPLSEHPGMRAELKVHAWRMARLNRVRAVAKAEEKTELVSRVDKLIDKEKARHQRRMDTLKTQGDAQ